jgi:hypothetical protein
MDFFDYSPAAKGMIYRTDVARAGVEINGEPDAVPSGRIGWETVDGPQGGLSIVHRVDTNVPGLGSTSYYLDDATPSGGAETQCTGDGAAWGSSGPWINQSIPNTDPRSSPFNTLTDSRTLFFELPRKADGERRSAQVDAPLQVSVAARG